MCKSELQVLYLPLLCVLISVFECVLSVMFRASRMMGSMGGGGGGGGGGEAGGGASEGMM